MADINRVVLAGRLTKDSELKYTTHSNMAVTRLSMAVNARRKQDDGWVDEAHFFEVTLFGKQGEALSNYLLKGKQIAVEGQLRQDRWEQDGQSRSRVYILADNIMLLGGTNAGSNQEMMGRSEQPRGSSPAARTAAPASRPRNKSDSAPIAPPVDFEDDIPF